MKTRYIIGLLFCMGCTLLYWSVFSYEGIEQPMPSVSLPPVMASGGSQAKALAIPSRHKTTHSSRTTLSRTQPTTKTKNRGTPVDSNWPSEAFSNQTDTDDYESTTEPFSAKTQRELALSVLPEVVGEDIAAREAQGFQSLPPKVLKKIANARMFPDSLKKDVKSSQPRH